MGNKILQNAFVLVLRLGGLAMVCHGLLIMVLWLWIIGGHEGTPFLWLLAYMIGGVLMIALARWVVNLLSWDFAVQEAPE